MNEWISIAKNGYDNGLMVDGVYTTDLIIKILIHNYLYLQSKEFLSGAFLKSDQFFKMHSLHNSLSTSVVKSIYMPFYLLLSS